MKRELNLPTKEALDALESVQFQISKMQFKLNQLADLFTREGGINTNLRDVQHKCGEFSTQSGEMFESTMNVRKSANNMRAEQLSPDQTAQLIANVVQNMGVNQTNASVMEHNDHNTSIMSGEDVLRQAL